MMGFDPNEPRDKAGKWAAGSSGHNAGGGNRTVARKIQNLIAEHSDFPMAKMPRVEKIQKMIDEMPVVVHPDDIKADRKAENEALKRLLLFRSIEARKKRK